jgi:hypothetical protein
MRVMLEIQPGSLAPRSVTIEAGTELRFGRVAPAHVVLNDPTVSRQHFAISYDGRMCRIRDLGSTHGTLVNDRPVTQGVLYDADLIRAGTTTLRVHFADDEIDVLPLPVVADVPTPSGPTAGLAATLELPALDLTLHDAVIRELRSEKEPLYAILDAARDPVILARLVMDCKEEYQSLYEGDEGVKLAAFAPYLVSLPRASTFLETIVREGWGKSWGVYLTCGLPFNEVRKHLRRFLMVKIEDGKPVYFRFYDPRVLRVFLPTCTPQESLQFFGPISCFCLEAEDGVTLLRIENKLHLIESVK